MLGVLFFILFFGLMIGLPVFVVLGLATFAPALLLDIADTRMLLSLSRNAFSSITRFSLLALPFYIMAGEVMVKSGIMSQLIELSDALVGRLRGGLAQINIIASMFFAGMSGSAIADTMALGSVLIPAMKEDGYDGGFAGAVTAASSIVGPIIPPSMVMVIYGSAFNLSIRALFAAGLVPGIFIGLMLMVVTYFYSVKMNHPLKSKKNFRQVLQAVLKGIIPMMMPIIILGGIFSGIFTATEASVIAVLYALIVGLFIYRTIRFKDLFNVFKNSVRIVSGAAMILAFAQNFSWILSRYQIPQFFVTKALSYTENPIAIILTVNLLLFIVGLFIDRTSALLILGPILIPIMTSAGIHPLHVAMILIFALGVGHLTPPFGMLLFTTAYAGHVSVESILKKIPMYIITLLFVNLIVSFFPGIVLMLPKYLGFIR